jgi:ABC-type transporter Mla subunit MlaD
MAEVKYGTVSVTIDDFLAPPDQAGKLSPAELARIARPPRGIGLACDQAADAIDKAGASFSAPKDVTAASLREAGPRADGIDLVIADLEVVLGILKQANALFDGTAYEQIRKVNDQVKAQGKHQPEIEKMFESVLAYFAKGPRKTPPVE